MIQSAAEFVDFWRHARARTLRVLEALPDDAELEWTYAPGRFTFGDLFRHLAGIERFMYGENVHGRPSAYPGHDASLAAGRDGVSRYVTRCHEEANSLFSALSEEQMRAKCLTPAGTPITVWKWLRAMSEHEAHHRGQLYLMASMRGLTIAPLFGLTEEEVLAASRP